MHNKILIIAMSLAVVGCAGSRFSFERARQVEVGMNEEQLTKLMGKPYSVVSSGDTQTWIWSYANALTGGSKSVSFIMKDGKVESLPTIPKGFK